MSSLAQVGQFQMGPAQFMLPYTLTDHYDSVNSGGRYHLPYGIGKDGHIKFVRPEQWTLQVLSTEVSIIPEISITSASGALVGKIRTDVQFSIVTSLEFKIDDNGCADFLLKLNALPDFPMLPFSIVSIKIGNTDFDWYAGEISYPDDRGAKSDLYEFRGVGLRDRLDGDNALKANTTYSAGLDVGAVAADICVNWIQPYSPIIYNEDKINQTTGVILANDIEISKMPIKKVLDTLATMGGCVWGVDGDKELYFETIETTLQRTLFVSYDINNFSPKTNLTDVKNAITVQRQQGAAEGGAGWAVAGLYNDATSIKKYGKKELNYQVPGYFEDDDCDTIGNALLAEKKDPKISGSVRGFQIFTGDDFLTRGPYRIVMPFDEFNEIYDDADDITDWDVIKTGDLTLTLDSDYLVHGAGSLKMDWTSAEGDLIQLEKDFSIGKIKKIRVFVSSENTGEVIKIGIGDGAWNQYTAIIDFITDEQFFCFDWNIEDLNISFVDRIGFQVYTADAGSVWINRIEFLCDGHQYYEFDFKKAKYKFSPTEHSIDIDFGVIPPKMENYISSLMTLATELKFTQEIIGS